MLNLSYEMNLFQNRQASRQSHRFLFSITFTYFRLSHKFQYQTENHSKCKKQISNDDSVTLFPPTLPYFI